MTTSIRTSADGLSSIIAVNGIDRFSIDQNGKATAAKFAGDGSELTGVTTLKRGVAVNTVAGTSYDFSGIPATAKQVTIVLDQVDTNGYQNIFAQLGTSAGVETTDYTCDASVGGSGAYQFSTGIVTNKNTDYSTLTTGALVLVNITGNTWVFSGAFGSQMAGYVTVVTGRKTLAGVLDRVRVLTQGGETFNSGYVNVFWE